MNRIKFALLIAAVVATFGAMGAGQANHCANGGSAHNAAGSCETSGNDTRCGEGTASQDSLTLYAAANGVEVCNEDGGAVPVEGRVGAMQGCSCAYGDGGDSNGPPANSWARVDQDGVNCGGAGQPSYNSAQGDPANCG